MHGLKYLVIEGLLVVARLFWVFGGHRYRGCAAGALESDHATIFLALQNKPSRNETRVVLPVVTTIARFATHTMRRGLERLVGTALTAGIALSEANPGAARGIGAILSRSGATLDRFARCGELTGSHSSFATEAKDAGDAGTSSDRVGVGMRGDGTAPRFYKKVEVVRVENGGGWGVALDGLSLIHI